MKLPESLYFLRPGWWLLHLVAIAAVFSAGLFVGQHHATAHHGPAHHDTSDHGAAHEGAAHEGAAHHGDDPHEAAHHEAHAPAAHDAPGGHEGHGASAHDHHAPEALRPLMRQLLSDATRLQAALAAGALDEAAPFADAIAAACGDPEAEEHGAPPAQLGPAFLEHDRALHGGARALAEALRAKDATRARALNAELTATCAACHAQAPAAQGLDLRPLDTFAQGLRPSPEAQP